MRSRSVTTTHAALPDVTPNQHHVAPAGSLTLLGGDVTEATVNLYTDVLSVVLPIGTYHLYANLSVLPNNNNQAITAKLWDGTTVASSGQQESKPAVTANEQHSIPLVGRVVSDGATAWKISFTCNVAAGAVAKASCVSNGAGANATWILAERVA